MRVAVIGCGAAGLAATRHLTKEGSGFTCVTYEQTDNVGGTWVYTDSVGKDKYGLPVHSSMYQNLVTNGPKELLEYPDFKYKGVEGQSYITASSVAKYLNEYADHFGLKEHIKFHHHVKSINVLENEKWVVEVQDMATQKEYVEHFDGVIVCVGIYSNPLIPDYDGLNIFKGQKMHSHDYRKNDAFKDKRVAIVGCGPSGLDITTDILKVAEMVYFSHHSAVTRRIQFSKNVSQKPDISHFTENNIVFVDGTAEEVDIVLFCTGYVYKYPFLSKEVGITVEDQYVQPLYKHMINIEHPSMCFVGIPKRIPYFYTFDMQVQYFLKTMKCPSLLPSKEAMKNDTGSDEIRRTIEYGHTQRQYHIMAKAARDYFNSLVEAGQLEPPPPVLLNMYSTAYINLFANFLTFRKDKYKILDQVNFEVETHKA